MRLFPILLILLCVCTITYSQNKLLTVKETEVRVYKDLAPQKLNNIQWKGSSLNFTYQNNDTVFQQSVKDKQSITSTTLKSINTILGNIINEPFSELPKITWINEMEYYFIAKQKLIIINNTIKKVVLNLTIPQKAENIHFNNITRQIAYTLDNNVFLLLNNGINVQVSHDKNPEIENGQSVSRNEFGIEDGIFWSPRGKHLAFYRKDNRDVADYPLVDVTTREAQLNNIKYPMAGMASEHISVGIYDISSGSTTYIEKQDSLSEKYLTNLSWSPDEKSLYIQILNREQNHMQLNQYNISDGSKVKTLFEEKSAKYIEPQNPIIFLNKNNDLFIYQSRRDGYNHAYLYNIKGELIKQLTSGNWEITSILDLDDNDNLWYLSTEDSSIEQQAYYLDISSNRKTKLTQALGSHSLIIDKSGKFGIDEYSSFSTPNVINMISSNGNVIRNILTSKNPLSEYSISSVNIGTIKAADGVTDLYYRLIKPMNFDSTKHYPAIIYVYGGPHAQLITNRWLGGARLWDYMMAQKGYVILTVDSRGSANRGIEFENAIHLQCGKIEMQDQMEGVKLLKKSGFTDTTRIGIFGWSYGGFMTISLMTHYPKTFKAAVAGGPVIDWKYYEVMYGERYMGNPKNNPQGYENSSLLPMAKDLKGKLLIIHGAIDKTVVWQNSQLFLQECIKNNIPVDYFIYPQAEHNVRGLNRMHLMDKISRYFDDYL